MQTKSSYHALAVGGASLAGLALAALALRQGKKVVLIDPSESAGGMLASVRKEGFSFSPGMDLTFGFERGGGLETFCSELGISLGASVLSPCYQVVLPDHRVSVYREQGETLDELRREFPADIDAFVRFYREMRRMAERCAKSRLAAYVASRRSSASFLARFRFSGGARAFLDAASLAFFQLPAAELPLSVLVMLVDSAPLSVRDGFPFLAEQIAAYILKAGGEIVYGTADVELLQGNGKAGGLKIPGSRTYDANSTLLSPPIANTCSGILLGVNNAVIPVGMARNVFCLPIYERLDSFFTLSVSEEESTNALHGKRAITALFPFLPPASSSFDARTDSVATVIPFLKRYIVTAAELPSRKDLCPYPDRFLRRPITSGRYGQQARRTELKQLYVLRDDPRCPMCAIIAAQLLARMLL